MAGQLSLQRDNQDESGASIRMRMPAGLERREGVARPEFQAAGGAIRFGAFVW